ncbi:MAG: hypothetical protein OQK48_06640 [Sulfurimonas sp.]|uniref:hypothetical protein n=1 Tax=Sulfurimonas sp. TaxID=2022749 RepID=UPI00261BBAC0|nr:hypothetical protein [Sulfurimonas sp.]MCW8894745.1 hypothetical protein [Sulfurimonas sp.]MCW8954610.1 hypothetical protein [Sulfurimonas sp.]MCW9067542.1 hypothetical protein [Sulfurimonas sp.]
MKDYKTIETLIKENQKLVEVELMLTPSELKDFANYCIKNDIKFNDWIRKLAYNELCTSSKKHLSP